MSGSASEMSSQGEELSGNDSDTDTGNRSNTDRTTTTPPSVTANSLAKQRTVQRADSAEEGLFAREEGAATGEDAAQPAPAANALSDAQIRALNQRALNDQFRQTVSLVVAELLTIRQEKGTKGLDGVQVRYVPFQDYLDGKLPFKVDGMKKTGQGLWLSVTNNATGTIRTCVAHFYFPEAKATQKPQFAVQGTFLHGVQNKVSEKLVKGKPHRKLLRCRNIEIVGNKQTKRKHYTCSVRGCKLHCLGDYKFCQNHIGKLFTKLSAKEQEKKAKEFMGCKEGMDNPDPRKQIQRILEHTNNFKLMDGQINFSQAVGYTLTEAGKKYLNDLKEQITKAAAGSKKRKIAAPNTSPLSVCEEW